MKKIFGLFLFLTLAASAAFACDAKMAKFPRDCRIQDRFKKIRADFMKKNVDVDEISEYRVMRFVHRYHWEQAKQRGTSPLRIYEPAPTTWQIWDRGTRSLFYTTVFTRLFYGPRAFNNETFSYINKVMLTNDTESVKDPLTDKNKNAGEFRNPNDTTVGFCFARTPENTESVEKAEKSMERYQTAWEQKYGMTLASLMRLNNVPRADEATFAPKMSVTTFPCTRAENMYISYTPSNDVMTYMDWMRVFIEANLKRYQEGNPALSPIALATFIQKWFVSIHPFADGNGRTSRSVQDLLLQRFELPFAPGGDLQNDALGDMETYLEETYQKTEAMLTTLENCAEALRTGAALQFQCATVAQLNEQFQ